MPDFTQQAAVDVAAAPGLRSGLPVIASLTLLHNSITPLAIPVCNQIGMCSTAAVGIGGNQEMLPASPGGRYYINYIWLKCSQPGNITLFNGASIVWYHYYTAAGEFEITLPFGGLQTPNVGGNLAFVNNTGVAVVLDSIIYAGLANA